MAVANPGINHNEAFPKNSEDFHNMTHMKESTWCSHKKSSLKNKF